MCAPVGDSPHSRTRPSALETKSGTSVNSVATPIAHAVAVARSSRRPLPPKARAASRSAAEASSQPPVKAGTHSRAAYP